jgi:protein-S-isoprenylcysteine O-methyltransferase Ste14
MQELRHTEITPSAGLPTSKAFTDTLLYDIICRFLPAYIFFFLVLGKTLDLRTFIKEPEHAYSKTMVYAVIASKISVVLFLALNMLMVLIRMRPKGRAKGILPRVTALAGAYMISLITVLPRTEALLAQTLFATVLILLGNALSIIAISTLGRSFSIMAEARRLVTTGFYSIVRHPLYFAETVASFGICLQFLSVYSVAIFVLYVWLQIQRMKNEEAVLAEVFPEYTNYKRRTARLIPGIY